jgi:isoleucyl-tRNA synthetase
MIELNKTINWKPKATGEGRFGNWLENMVDWNLSRSRYWGTPLPVWMNEEGSEVKCIGSVEELNNEIKYANEKLNLQQVVNEKNLDLHKPFVDGITLADSQGRPMKREPDLIDVWFDSGAMPYAQGHYPFENQANIDQNKAFPADFIAEGVDQTRGWFYTLHALGVMLFDSVAYKTVVANGLVLDKNGNKMSKRVGNVVDPFETIEKLSADATRWYLITNASPWDSLKFDLEGIKEIQRKYFGTLYNTYQFFALYANVDNFTFKETYIPIADRPEIDRWILSSLQTLIKNVHASLDDYEPTQAGRAMENFLDEQLSNWYVRLCRRRFWKGEYEFDKICAYQTLYECLEQLSLMMAPISPFFADWMFNNLNKITNRVNSESVHLAKYPIANDSYIDTELEARMELAQLSSSLVLSIRKKVNIKVRQPLQKLMIPVLDAKIESRLRLVEDLIKNEVNVKEIEYITETEGVIKKKAKANFKTLGAKLGGKMKAAAALINNLDQQQIAILEREQSLNIMVDGEQIILTPEDMDIIAEDIPGWSVAHKDSLTVALDISISEELQHEGNAREIVNRIQKIRKDADYELTDRIAVFIEKNAQLNDSIIKFYTYICAEILADKMDIIDNVSDGVIIEVNETPIKIQVLKNRQ